MGWRDGDDTELQMDLADIRSKNTDAQINDLYLRVIPKQIIGSCSGFQCTLGEYGAESYFWEIVQALDHTSEPEKNPWDNYVEVDPVRENFVSGGMLEKHPSKPNQVKMTPIAVFYFTTPRLRKEVIG